MSGRRFIAILLCVTACGCAGNSGGTDLGLTSTPNPVTGDAFRLTVTDKRQFAPGTSAPSVPSLDGAAGSADSALRQRVFGLSDETDGLRLLAPETSVRQAAWQTLANALRASGYRVVTEADPAFATAKPLGADLEKFWAWTVLVPPEPVALHYYECAVDLHLGGDWPLADYGERRLRGNEWMFRPDASDAHSGEILKECLGEIDDVLKRTLKRPATP